MIVYLLWNLICRGFIFEKVMFSLNGGGDFSLLIIRGTSPSLFENFFLSFSPSF